MRIENKFEKSRANKGISKIERRREREMGRKKEFQKLDDTQTNFGNRRAGHEISKTPRYLI